MAFPVGLDKCRAPQRSLRTRTFAIKADFRRRCVYFAAPSQNCNPLQNVRCGTWCAFQFPLKCELSWLCDKKKRKTENLFQHVLTKRKNGGESPSRIRGRGQSGFIKSTQPRNTKSPNHCAPPIKLQELKWIPDRLVSFFLLSYTPIITEHGANNLVMVKSRLTSIINSTLHIHSALKSESHVNRSLNPTMKLFGCFLRLMLVMLEIKFVPD